MILNTKKIGLLKWILKDEFKHEFFPLMAEIKKKLNIRVNQVALFLIFLIYQYTFIFLLLLLLYGIREKTLFLLVLLLVSFFNLMLPGTIARASFQRIEENPLFDSLLMSELSINESKRLIVLAELGSFWIHNFYLEMISIGLLIIRYKFIGVVCSLLWIIAVSFIFLKTLLKKADLQHTVSDSNSLRLYVFRLIASGVVVYNIFYFLIGSLSTISIEEFFSAEGLRDYLKNYLEGIAGTFKDNSLYFIGIISLLIYIYILISVWEKKVRFVRINEKKTLFQKKYGLFLCKMTKNFFVQRDIKWIVRILSKLEMNIFQLIFPSAIIFLVISFVFLVCSNKDPYAVLISLDFIFWVGVYQFSYFLVQKIPIFNISSELRNIDLITMSNKEIRQLIKAKHILLSMFCCPLLIFIIFAKLIMIYWACNIGIVLFSLFIDMLIFEICILLSLKWTLILPRFDWDNIFMLKLDNFDTQILRQFLLIPSRIVTLFFSVSFAFVQIVEVYYQFSAIALYYLLALVGCVIMYIIFRRRNKDEIAF